MTLPAKAADALLEASVVGSFSRIGLAARSRLLPEFTSGGPTTLEGRSVVITGATSGIGYATAAGLARLGAAVHFLARDRARADSARHRRCWPPASPASSPCPRPACTPSVTDMGATCGGSNRSASSSCAGRVMA